MTQRRSDERKRPRPFYRKTLFYAGTLGDGSPRNWSLADLLIVGVLLMGVVIGGFLIFEWLWGNFLNP